jgi:hypothetical protein
MYALKHCAIRQQFEPVNNYFENEVMPAFQTTASDASAGKGDGAGMPIASNFNRSKPNKSADRAPEG